MTARMPDFSMPSDDEVQRRRARADDEAREADARAAMRDADADAAVAHGAARDAPADDPAARRGPAGRILAIARDPVAAFVAGAALVAAAFVVVPAVQREAEAGSLAQLERVVAEYVGAIESGDLAAATALARPDPGYAEIALLGAADPSSSPTIDCAEPRVDDDRATVTCSVALPTFGSSAPMRIELAREGAWRIDVGLAVASPLLVSLADVEAVGGAPLPDVELGVDPVWLYPGQYALDLVLPAQLGTSSTELAVRADGAYWIGGVTIDDALRAEIREAGVAYVEGCATAGGVGCPPVEPLGEGQRWEALDDGFISFTRDDSVGVGLDVRRVGGAPFDRVRLRVDVVYDDDLDDYELVAIVEPGM
ncbi:MULTISPECIES: hypothetical protein [unclassified Agrococcus]|uniref:hypothetical protein n=1 Tax=unclassified Agrococcus TaxID=2615065 RepID=UPI003612A016